ARYARMRSEVPGSALMTLVCLATSSAALWYLVQAIERIPSPAKVARRRADSQLDEAQDSREPVASSPRPSLKGGFQKANRRSPRGLPSPLTSVKGTPTRRSARSPGLPMVAEVRMNLGSDP